MKLCVLTTSFPRNNDDDAGIFVKHLVAAFSEKGMRGCVVVPKDLEPESLERVGAFAVERVKYGIIAKGQLAVGAGIVPNIRAHPVRLFQAPALILALAARLYSRRKECALAHANWSICALPAWIVSLVTGLPYAVTLRGEDVALL